MSFSEAFALTKVFCPSDPSVEAAFVRADSIVEVNLVLNKN